MIRKIVKDEKFLSVKSQPASVLDKGIITDLMDTLNAHKDTCVGMAANMIGYQKRIIIFNMGNYNFVMVNPVITKMNDRYKTKEGCLSLSGERETYRYKSIEVEYQDTLFQKQKGKYTGWIAQIIQHEIDHCDGILI